MNEMEVGSVLARPSRGARFIRACMQACTLLLGCLIYGSVTLNPLWAVEPAAGNSPVEIRGQVSRLLKELDSDRFDTRQRAAATFEGWVARPDLGQFLASEFQQALVDPKLSFEVRWQLERWSRRLPEVAAIPVKEVPAGELDRMFAELDADSYAARLGASRRLAWLLGNATLACTITQRLKQRMADPNLSPESWRRLESLWQQARGAWLASDPADWHLPPVTDAQIRLWVDELAQPSEGKAASPRSPQAIAEQELLDVLARDDDLPRVKQIVQQRLAAPIDREGAVRLKAIQRWMPPAMVAECWQEHHQVTEQHLIVGEPSLAENAQRPSYFDRIDDRVAHCVSGQTLQPGNYPVGVAFPHPTQDTAFFCLYNLPTPRRQMAYAYHVQTDESKRLAEISRRTFAWLLREKRPLAEREVTLLPQLDHRELSRFAGKYFLAIDDEPVSAADAEEEENRTSRHGLICTILANFGTRDVIPDLTEAIAKRRFLPPAATPGYRAAWWAALSIAQRDPWPEVDSWLVKRVSHNDVLIEGVDEKPELGATAAGLLLVRHHQSPTLFGLHSTGMPPERISRVEGYRFASADAAARVQRWWDEESRQ